MKKRLICIACFIISILSCCYSQLKTNTMIQISTSYGNITVKLYDETPLHRDNFIKLVKQGFYNDLLFHRVIKDFMIQGGDPQSKNAPAGKQLGAGDVGYTIPAEFAYPKYYHKKGALAAARQGDQVNPKKASSGCQFYIVEGKTYNDKEIEQLENRMLNTAKQTRFYQLANEHSDEIKNLRIKKDSVGIEKLQNQLISQLESEFANKSYKMPEQMKNDYKTIGGTPFLDNEYTVFGEIVEGMEVIDKIAAVEKNASDRPKQDIKMTVKILE